MKARFFIIKAINSAELAKAKASSRRCSKRHSLTCSLKYLRGSLKINVGGEDSKRKSDSEGGITMLGPMNKVDHVQLYK